MARTDWRWRGASGRLATGEEAESREEGQEELGLEELLDELEWWLVSRFAQDE